jgi:hypothetical protein
MFIIGTNCSGVRLIGAETTVSGSYMNFQSSTFSVTTSGTVTNCSVAEISQTAVGSVITLGYTNLLFHSANGYGFTITQSVPNYLMGTYGPSNGASSWGDNFDTLNAYLNAGSTVLSNIVTLSGSSMPYTVLSDCILHGCILRTNKTASFANASTVLYANLYCNVPGINPFLTLSIGRTTPNNTIIDDKFSIKMLANDSIYVQLSGASSNNAANPTSMTNAVVDFGLF